MPDFSTSLGTINPGYGIEGLATFKGVNDPIQARGNVPAPNALVNVATDVLRADGTWGAGGGGGGGAPTVSTTWSTGGTSKNGNVTAGINLNIALTMDQPITVTSVTVGGVALIGPFTLGGSFPNRTLAVVAANVPAAVQTAGGLVSVQGLYNSVGYAAAGGTLTIVAAVPFAITLSGSYPLASAPFYTTTATLSYAYTNTVGTVTTLAGVFTPGGTASATSGSFPNTVITGSVISGSATGTGLNGAGTGTVTFSGSVAAVPTYTPAFWVQTSNNTPPTFTTASSQTPTAAAGSIITYTEAVASSQFNWVCTQRPLVNLFLRTSFGDGRLVPDVTGANQTIAGQVFQVYGWSKLAIGNSSRLVIT